MRYAAPCGGLLLGSYGGLLCLCDWEAGEARRFILRRLCRLLGCGCVEGTDDVLLRAARQLDEYFGRERATFDVPLRLVGTPFQEAVWQLVAGIPYGHTLTYAGLACWLGRPSAVRAVANASRANALSVFVPCHRVVGSDSSLTGYAGGLAAKKFLLSLECADLSVFLSGD